MAKHELSMGNKHEALAKTQTEAIIPWQERIQAQVDQAFREAGQQFHDDREFMEDSGIHVTEKPDFPEIPDLIVPKKTTGREHFSKFDLAMENIDQQLAAASRLVMTRLTRFTQANKRLLAVSLIAGAAIDAGALVETDRVIKQTAAKHPEKANVEWDDFKQELTDTELPALKQAIEEAGYQLTDIAKPLAKEGTRQTIRLALQTANLAEQVNQEFSKIFAEEKAAQLPAGSLANTKKSTDNELSIAPKESPKKKSGK